MKHQQNGVALIAAIFLVVIIGAAVVLLAGLSVRNTGQTNQSLLQSRASLAVQAGIDATVQRLIVNSIDSWCDGSSQAVNVPTYSNFNVSVTCSAFEYNRPSQPVHLYNISATAEYGSQDSPDYVWVKNDVSVEL